MNKRIDKNIKKIISMGLLIFCISSVVGCSKSNEEVKKNSTHNNQNIENAQESTENSTAEQSGSIVTLGDRAFEVFKGSSDASKPYIDAINNNKFENDVQVYNIVIPTHVEFGLPDKYSEMSNPQKPIIDEIYKNVADKVKTIDVYSTLEKHKDEYIYFNTDHHWTSLGAYYAYEEFAKNAGFTPLELSDLEKHTKENFLGSLYTQTQDNNLKSNPDSVDYYKIPADYEVYRYEKGNPLKSLKTTLYADYASGINSYSVFLHGDFPKIEIKNKNLENKKKIVVVKESYANAFVPFLVPHYEEIIVVDSRYYEGNLNDLVKEKEADEVLFINNIFATNTEKIVNTISDLNK